jgi:hypothetical protein
MTEPSLTLHNGTPCFVTDDTVQVSQAPELFDTGNGAIGLADGYMQLLAARYPSVEAMREHAQQKIDEYGLIDQADSDAYSIWLLVAMTI